MIVAAAVCPHPPLLFRELCGLRDPLPDLRIACHRAVSSLTALEPDEIIMVGGADVTDVPADPTPLLRRYGAPEGTVTGRRTLMAPLSLAVADRLLDEVSWTGPRTRVAIGLDDPVDDVVARAREIAETSSSRSGLLVMGDGSARRGDKAPGFVDERAFAYDAEIGRCLTEGDAEGLLRMDAGLAEELLVKGRAALQVLAAVAEGQDSRNRHASRHTMLYADDPLGVMYFVATWDLAALEP